MAKDTPEPRVELPEDEQFPRYVRLHLKESPMGSGQRDVVLVERRGKRYRVLDPYYCRAFWLPAWAVLLPRRTVAELPLHGLAARIRRNRRDRALLGMPFSAPATRQVLTMLRGGNRPTTADQQDDAVYDRDVNDEADPTEEDGDDAMRTDDTNAAPEAAQDATATTATAEATAAGTATGTGKAKKAKAAKGKAKATKGAKVQADPRISGKPITNGATAGEGKGKKAKAAKTPKEAKAKGDGNKKGYGTATDDSVITLRTQENKFKGERGMLFGLMRDQMTVGQFMKAAEKKGVPANKARHGLRSFRNMEALDYTTTKQATA